MATRPSTEDVNKAALARENPYAALDMAMTKATTRLAEIVPKHVDPRRVVQLALSCARKDEKLLRCTVSSVLIATSQIAALGLEPGTALQQAYLVPRTSRKLRGGAWVEVHEATAIIGYRGFVLLAYDSEGIDCQAAIVRIGDHFVERGGILPILEHSKSEADEMGELRGAYAVWELSSGKRRHLWWTRRELNAHRDRFAPRASYVDGRKLGKDEEHPITGPWKDHVDPMRLKTMVRMASKLWPLSSDRMRHALTVDDAGETGRAALSFVPGAEPGRVRDLALSLGEPPETFDAAGEDEGPPSEEEPEAEPGRQPGEEG